MAKRKDNKKPADVEMPGSFTVLDPTGLDSTCIAQRVGPGTLSDRDREFLLRAAEASPHNAVAWEGIWEECRRIRATGGPTPVDPLPIDLARAAEPTPEAPAPPPQSA